VYFEYICSTFARCLLDRVNGVLLPPYVVVVVVVATAAVSRLHTLIVAKQYHSVSRDM